MTPVCRHIAVLLLALVPGGWALAGDPPPAPRSPEQAADEVLAARTAGDPERLAAVARLDDPDPWLVADVLLGRGEAGAALALATAVPRPDLEALATFLKSRTAWPAEPGARASLAQAESALAAGDPAAALAALDAAGPAEGTLLAVRLEHARGLALRARHEVQAADVAFLGAAARAAGAGWLARQSLALHEAGLCAFEHADYATAIDRWRRQIEVAKARGAGWDVGRTLLNLGHAHRNLGKVDEALGAYDEALRRLDAAHDTRGVAAAYAGFGTVYWTVGRLAEAQAAHEKALALQQTIDPLGAARTLTNLGLVQRSLGNLTRAVQYYEQALKEKQALGQGAEAARTLLNLGTAHQLLGRNAKALECFEVALREFERAGDRLRAAAARSSIGFLYETLGAYDRALEQYAQALAIQAQIDPRGEANTWANIGSVHRQTGELSQALADAERSLRIRRAIRDQAGEAETLRSMGLDHAALGNAAKAREHLEQALALYVSLKDRAGQAATRVHLAATHAALGDLPGALAAAKKAAADAESMRAESILVDALRCLAGLHLAAKDWVRAQQAAKGGVDLLEHLYGGLTEEQGAGARERASDLFDVGVLASLALDDTAQACWFLESGRAGALLESLGNQQALRWEALSPTLRVAETEARQAEAFASAAFTRALAAGVDADVRATGTAAAAARARVEEVEAQIQRESKREASVFYPKAAPFDAIQSRLGDGDALVLYAVCRDECLALVLTSADARLVALGKAARVGAAADALELDAPGDDPQARIDTLAGLVIAPLGLPASVTRVLVSPEGPLSYVPFAVLLASRTVAYVPSGTTYGVLLDDARGTGKGILALGDPDYAVPTREGLAAPGRVGAGRLARLPGTRDEALLVDAGALLGADASEVRLRESLAKHGGRWRAVHFACHGLLDPDKPTLSSLALSPDPENDGYLTALDVFRMQIPADLVVLSACETGKGRVVKGEGIVGLTRAFMFAGAPSVLCSLWKVDDAATRALMEAFYAAWNPKDGRPGRPAAEALRAAQAAVRREPKWQHPYFWAAWVLWGLPG